MAKLYIPKKGERFKVFVKIPAIRGEVFVCTGRCYSSGYYSCVEARLIKDKKPHFEFNRRDFIFEQVQ